MSSSSIYSQKLVIPRIRTDEERQEEIKTAPKDSERQGKETPKDSDRRGKEKATPLRATRKNSERDPEFLIPNS
jgi:hypothetical protein